MLPWSKYALETIVRNDSLYAELLFPGSTEFEITVEFVWLAPLHAERVAYVWNLAVMALLFGLSRFYSNDAPTSCKPVGD